MKQIVEQLAKKAGEAKTALEALQFSQAAANVSNAACNVASAERDVKAATPAHKVDAVMAMPSIDAMVERFLAWRLPKDFNPDGGVVFERRAGYDVHTPAGTNLFTATQAKAMVYHMLGVDFPKPPPHKVSAERHRAVDHRDDAPF